MAEAAALAGAGWVASPVITKLLNKGFSYFGDNDIKDRLENLETTILPQFQLVIEAAERSNQHKAKLEKWLRKLKDAMYEAEDMLDLYQYELLEKKVHLLSHPTPKSFGKLVGKMKKGLSSPFSPQKKKLKDNLVKLESIATEASTFRELLGIRIGSNTANDTTSGKRPNATTSLLPPRVFGRNQERDKIIKCLLDESEACESEMSTVRSRSYSGVTVVGIGGAGKTTLAQLVYNDQNVVNNFGIKMWVCMSRKLDVFRLTREMIESASKEECPCLENFDALQSKLIDEIESKKVLLVLDDVWCYKSENEVEWEQLLAPLSFGEKGSKILMTTRPENMANMPGALRSQKIMELKDLEEDQFTSLFMHYAFGGTNLSDMHFQEELKTIGKQILQKLSRSPLAAKAVGCQLSKRLEVEVWRATLEQDNLSDIQKALIWSYQRLDAPLQRCFSYFSLFPKGHTCKEEEMVQLWMAEGFINPSDDSKRMEDIGHDYWVELLSGSFLQLDEECEDTKYCYMHDLFHDLAEIFSNEDCFRIEDDQVKNIPRAVRRLYVSSESTGKGSISFDKLYNLRTLIIHRPFRVNATDLLIAAVDKSEKLRVLKLSCRTKSLPKFIRGLKHLRYLDLGDSDVAELPVSLGKLHHLQLLELPCLVISLPRSLKNLLNLRHLKATQKTLSTLTDIGRLTSLQSLSCFEVKKEKGYDIGQLKHLNEIRGLLTICHLQNIEGKDEAIGASLKDKKHLDRLCLEWCNDNENGCRMNLDMEVIEGLQPPPNLTELEIHGCKSPKCPNWLVRERCLENLRSLSFRNTSFEDFPDFSKLFPHFETLKIVGVPNLRMIPLLPQSQRQLTIVSCPLLIFISQEELHKSNDIQKSIMTAVRSSELDAKLKIMEDKKGYVRELLQDYLQVNRLMESEKLEVPEDFQTLVTTMQSEEMSMQLDYHHLWDAYCRCQEQRLEAIFRRREKSELILPSLLRYLQIAGCQNITDGALSLCLGTVTSLKSLTLDGIKTITTVPTEHLIELSSLHIVDCPCLKSLGALHNLLSLELLEISCCPCLELEMMEGEGGGTSGGSVILPPLLEFLTVNNCTNMKRLAIGGSPVVDYLELCKLPSLASLSLSGVTALKNLEIRDCPELTTLVFSLGNTEAVHFPLVEELRISSWATLRMLLSGGSERLAGLSILRIHSCSDASFDAESFNCLTSLKILDLFDCKVKSLPASLKTLSSLEELTLVKCPDVSFSSSNLPECLKSLTLMRCQDITSLPDLPNSLHHLLLDDCPGISSLPVHLPKSLRTIKVFSCPVLTKRCQEPNGEDWPKISHILDILMV